MAYHTQDHPDNHPHNHPHDLDSLHHTQTNWTHPTATPRTAALRQTKPAARLQAQQGLRPWVAGMLSVALGVGPSLGLGTIGALNTGNLSVLAQTETGSAGMLTRWRFNSQTQVLEVILPAGVNPRSFLLARPMRLVVDFPNSILPGVPPTQTYGGMVRRVTWSQYDATTARVVMELDSNVVLAPQQVDMQQMEAGRWSIRPVIANPEAFAEIAPTPIPAAPVATAPDPIVPPNTPPTSPTPIDLPNTALAPDASLLTSLVTSPTVTSSLNNASDLAPGSEPANSGSASESANSESANSESANDVVRQVLADRIAAFNGVQGVQPSETATTPLGNPGEAGSLIPIQSFGVNPTDVSPLAGNPNTVDPTGVSSAAIESTGVDPTGADLTAMQSDRQVSPQTSPQTATLELPATA
ncbi:MAG: AMIN domain-containing protein, partial [Prochlorothrix sp.]|nr:AMIN domain-containing protein [Prochlorothrix sp.]